MTQLAYLNKNMELVQSQNPCLEFFRKIPFSWKTLLKISTQISHQEPLLMPKQHHFPLQFTVGVIKAVSHVGEAERRLSDQTLHKNLTAALHVYHQPAHGMTPTLLS